MPTPTEWVARQQASGLCPHRFARIHDIPKTTFYTWLQNYEPIPTVRFIDITPKPPSDPPPIRVYLDERPVSFDVEPDTALNLLRAVIDALC